MTQPAVDREEWLAARDVQESGEHPAACMCGCRWVRGDDRRDGQQEVSA